VLRVLALTVAMSAVVSLTYAQGVRTARVIRTAVIVTEPRGDASVVSTVPPGVVLELVGERGEWYQVRLIAEAGIRPLGGWVHRDLVEFLPTTGAATPAPASPSSAGQPRTATGQPVPTAPIERITVADQQKTQQPSSEAQAPVSAQQRPAPTPPTGAPVPVRSGREPLSAVRNGFWFSLGMGVGSACNDGCLRGLSGGLSLGGTVNPHVLFGLGTTGYYRELLGATVEAGTLDARLRIYPWLNSGAFFTGGIGLGTVSVDDESAFGVGFMPGFGWDIRVGRKVSLTPYYDWFLIRGNGIKTNVEQLGLAFTIH
jgi:hypothetical protein